MATGFGSDLACTTGLVTGRMIGGARLLQEAVYRRLTTPRGTLAGDGEESTYGFDLTAYVGSVGGELSAVALPALVEAELSKDDRIASTRVVVTHDTASDGMTSVDLTIYVTPVDDIEDFALTLGVSDVGVSIMGGL